MGYPAGPVDWHLAVGLWQWDHPIPDGDYLNQNPAVWLYDFQIGYTRFKTYIEFGGGIAQLAQPSLLGRDTRAAIT